MSNVFLLNLHQRHTFSTQLKLGFTLLQTAESPFRSSGSPAPPGMSGASDQRSVLVQQLAGDQVNEVELNVHTVETIIWRISVENPHELVDKGGMGVAWSQRSEGH